MHCVGGTPCPGWGEVPLVLARTRTGSTPSPQKGPGTRGQRMDLGPETGVPTERQIPVKTLPSRRTMHTGFTIQHNNHLMFLIDEHCSDGERILQFSTREITLS